MLKQGTAEHRRRRDCDRLARQCESDTKEFKRVREESDKRKAQAMNQVLKDWNQKRRLATD